MSEWRRKWIAQVFPDLVPRSKWKQIERNLRVGDGRSLEVRQVTGVRLLEIGQGRLDLLPCLGWPIEMGPEKTSILLFLGVECLL